MLLKGLSKSMFPNEANIKGFSSKYSDRVGLHCQVDRVDITNFLSLILARKPVDAWIMNLFKVSDTNTAYILQIPL